MYNRKDREPGRLDPRPVSRRRFLAGLSAFAGVRALHRSSLLAATLNADAGKNAAGIPLRVLGRTGEKITIVGLGSAPVGHSMPGAEKGVAVYRAALEAGINYVDTAHGYDDAEGYLGELVPQYRDKIFLVTKSLPNGPDPQSAAAEMQRQFDMSLRKLKTDHVDLLHIHSVGNFPTDIVLGAGGALEFARKMKDQGYARFIGITAHCRPSRLRKIIETGEIDALMVVLNFADYHTYRFEEEILPVARQHRCGILAMKVFGGHRNGFAGYRQRGPCKMPAEFLERALRYALGIDGVAAAIVGTYGVEEVLQNIEWAKRYQPLSGEEQTQLRTEGKTLAAEWRTRFGPLA
jgi:uncharacterized protein